MKPQIYAYVRWSSDEQTQGDSLRRQTEGVKAYAIKHGLALPDTHIIIDRGLSAFTGENITRGKLGQFLERARTRKVGPGILIVENLDRLSRQGIDATRDIIRDLGKAGRHQVTSWQES